MREIDMAVEYERTITREAVKHLHRVLNGGFGPFAKMHAQEFVDTLADRYEPTEGALGDE